MKYRILSAAFALMLFASSCHRHYTSRSFEQKAAGHKSIAVLPAKMVFTGTQPRNLTPEQIARIEEEESRTFQRSLYNNILALGNRGSKNLNVQVQPPENTYALLEKAGLSVRDSWNKDDRELARLLGVDAVVRMSVQKNRYMSDLASFGISLGSTILNTVLTKGPVVPSFDKTNDIIAHCTLAANGETLWNDSYKRASDWTDPANAIIERITVKFARHFPYRKA